MKISIKRNIQHLPNGTFYYEGKKQPQYSTIPSEQYQTPVTCGRSSCGAIYYIVTASDFPNCTCPYCGWRGGPN